MKAKLTAFVLTALLAASLKASPLAATVAVQLSPNASAPTYTYLKAGTTPTPAASVTAPSGWVAVELPGPHEGYVKNKDLSKGMDPKPGSTIYTRPDVTSPVLTTAERDDRTTISGMTGKWVQVQLDRTLVGYYQVSAPLQSAVLPAAPASPVAQAPAAAAPLSAAPVLPGMMADGRAMPATVSSDNGAGSLPRQFTGSIVSARRLLGPRPVYPYQLNDDNGSRLAYLDLSKIALAGPIDGYLNRPVVIFGAASNLSDGKSIVIVVESLQIK
jgi:hypothetical protein